MGETPMIPQNDRRNCHGRPAILPLSISELFPRGVDSSLQRRTNMSNRPKKIAIFPGQFDPITNGHLDVIRRGVGLFDELVVAVGINPDKREFFTTDERVSMIRSLVKEMEGVRVEKYTGLTVEFAKSIKATVILRGIRDVLDLRYEFQLAMANRVVGTIETVFIMTGDQYALTSSSLIRQVVALGGDVRSLSQLLPAVVVNKLREKQRNGDLRQPEITNPDE
jgi:pantetheine-phosphate adenylyltransferase